MFSCLRLSQSNFCNEYKMNKKIRLWNVCPKINHILLHFVRFICKIRLVLIFQRRLERRRVKQANSESIQNVSVCRILRILRVLGAFLGILQKFQVSLKFFQEWFSADGHFVRLSSRMENMERVFRGTRRRTSWRENE